MAKNGYFLPVNRYILETITVRHIQWKTNRRSHNGLLTDTDFNDLVTLSYNSVVTVLAVKYDGRYDCN